MLDEIDWKILKELQEDAKITAVELGHRVNLSSPAVTERIHKLEDAEIITDYQAKINTKKVGLAIMAFILIDISHKDTGREIRKVVDQSPEIIECHKCAGNYSFILKVAVKDSDHLEEVINRFTPYGMPNTSLVLSSHVESRIIEQQK